MSNDVCYSPWLSIRAAPSFVQRELGDDEACLFLVKAANEPATAANKIERAVSTAMGDELGPELGNSRKRPASRVTPDCASSLATSRCRKPISSSKP